MVSTFFSKHDISIEVCADNRSAKYFDKKISTFGENRNLKSSHSNPRFKFFRQRYDVTFPRDVKMTS